MDILNKDKEQIRKEERERRRLKILSAALDVFIQKGYAATTINDIAHAVDMNNESVMHYFESKEKIYEELVRIGKNGIPSIIKNNEEEPLQFFNTVTEEMFRYIEKYPFFAKMFVFMPQVYANDTASDTVKKILSEGVENQLFSLFQEKIKHGQSNGTIKEGDANALINALFGAINGIAMQTAVANIPLPDSKWIVDIIKNHG